MLSWEILEEKAKLLKSWMKIRRLEITCCYDEIGKDSRENEVNKMRGFRENARFDVIKFGKGIHRSAKHVIRNFTFNIF